VDHLTSSPDSSKENAPNYTWQQQQQTKSSLHSSSLVVDLVNPSSGKKSASGAAKGQDNNTSSGGGGSGTSTGHEKLRRTAYDPQRLVQLDRKLLMDAGILVQEYRYKFRRKNANRLTDVVLHLLLLLLFLLSRNISHS
jgi:hypothetical protein